MGFIDEVRISSIARNPEELKVHAFERCGRKYKVLAYEDDTVRIECLGKKD